MDKTIEEKIWDKGKKLYDNFASQFGLIYATPRTNTLEMFVYLREKKEKELLLREMMSEFLINLSDEKIVVKDHKVYSVSEKLTKI